MQPVDVTLFRRTTIQIVDTDVDTLFSLGLQTAGRNAKLCAWIVRNANIGFGTSSAIDGVENAWWLTTGQKEFTGITIKTLTLERAEDNKDLINSLCWLWVRHLSDCNLLPRCYKLSYWDAMASFKFETEFKTFKSSYSQSLVIFKKKIKKSWPMSNGLPPEGKICLLLEGANKWSNWMQPFFSTFVSGGS